MLQEVAIMRKVRHRNVVQFIGACTRRPNLCIVFEFMAGGSIYDYMRKVHSRIGTLADNQSSARLHHANLVLLHAFSQEPTGRLQPASLGRDWELPCCYQQLQNAQTLSEML